MAGSSYDITTRRGVPHHYYYAFVSKDNSTFRKLSILILQRCGLPKTHHKFPCDNIILVGLCCQLLLYFTSGA